MNTKSFYKAGIYTAIAFTLATTFLQTTAYGATVKTNPEQNASANINSLTPDSAQKCLDIDNTRGARIAQAYMSYMMEYPERSMQQVLALLSETTVETKLTTDLEFLTQSVGSGLSGQAKYNEALKMFDALLATKQRLYGQDSMRLVETLNYIADIHVKAKDNKAAQACLRRIMSIVDKSTQKQLDKAYDLAILWEQLAATQLSTKDYAAAEASLMESLKLRRDVLGADGDSLANSYEGLGRLAEATGNKTKALEHYLNALAVYDARQPSSGNARELRNKIRTLCTE